MGWRFRKSFSPLPGVRLNFSPGGLSTSIGVGPLRLSVGQRGAALTTRIPGTGMSFRQPLQPPTSGALVAPSLTPAGKGGRLDSTSLSQTPVVPELGEGEIRSAGTSELTSPGLTKFRELLTQAQQERRTLLPELERAAVASTRLI
jgi:hypothetical protein